jgi:hypothetical protein
LEIKLTLPTLFFRLNGRANLEYDADRFDLRRFVALQPFFAEDTIPPASPWKHYPDGAKADNALTISLDSLNEAA